MTLSMGDDQPIFLKFALVFALRFKASKSRPPEDMCGAIATDVGKDL